MFIIRNQFNRLFEEYRRNEITILLGARQVGKTFLLKKLEEQVRKSGKSTQYFNLEFPDDLNFFAKSNSELFQFFKQHSSCVFFIDEFHYLENASKLFKALYDLELGIKIFASGSSSIEIHKHLKESLVGRRRIFNIFPLTFSEFAQTGSDLESYILYGGMPGIIHEITIEEKIELLRQIVETYLLKDIKSLIKEENIRAFNAMLFFLANHQGSMLPIANLAREIGLTAKSVERYLTIMEKTFVLFSLPSFATNFANELKKSKKYYLFDLGIRNLLCKNFASLDQRQDLGILAETFVFLALRNAMKPNVDLSFWRTKQGDEVDFIWIKDRIPVPIEVKTNFTSSRPTKGMELFFARYPAALLGVIFNRNYRKDLIHNEKRILVRRWEDAESIAKELMQISTKSR